LSARSVPHDPGLPSAHDVPVSLERPELEALLAELSPLRDPLQVAAAARGAVGPELGRRVAELVDLRRRARGRGADPALVHLTPKGLEQATRPAVAAWRAARLAAAVAPPAPAFDPACGLGADAVALARAGFTVHLADRSWATLRCARAHLVRAGHAAGSAARADAMAIPWRASALSGAVLVLDPDRRPGGAREAEPECWSPPLPAALDLAARAAAACVKCAPALEVAPWGLEAGARTGAWVSESGELVELSLWTGSAARADAAREAVVLAAGAVTVLAGEPEEVAPLAPADVPGVVYLTEPDVAVIRAGLVGLCARSAGLAPLGERIAYLGGPRPGPAGLSRSWPVLATVPLDRKQVRRRLGELDIGPLTVKKRGHPDTAEVLARRLAGPGSRPGLLAVTRLGDVHVALVLGPEVRTGEPGGQSGAG
jgi:hypothetical protein